MQVVLVNYVNTKFQPRTLSLRIRNWMEKSYYTLKDVFFNFKNQLILRLTFEGKLQIISIYLIVKLVTIVP